MKKLWSLALAFCLVLGLAGCGGEESKPLRLDMAGGIGNLDPQFATDPWARVIIANCLEGLVRQEADGTIVPAAAEDFTLSPDGLTYTFTLREDARWSRYDGRDPDADGGPVTAYDFEFAFRRLFDPQVPSPYCGEYLMIRGAAEALAGEAPVESIGVEAIDQRTLRITLTQAAPFFLRRLAEPPAMPCSQTFFEETRGRYGLEAPYLQCNGPYRLARWDKENSLVLEASQQYRQEEGLTRPQVIFYTSRLQEEDGSVHTPRELFLEGKSDIAQVEYGDLEELEKQGAACTAFDDAVWVLAFNQRKEVLANDGVRLALASVLEREELGQRTPEPYTPADSLVPPGARVFDKSYLELAGKPRLPQTDSGTARELLEQGLAEAGYDTLPTLTLLVPQWTEMGSLAGYFQKLWQQGLNQYVNLRILPESQYYLDLYGGENWDMAILPVQTSGDDPAGTLTAFTSGSAANHTGYADPEYDRLLEQAQSASQLDQSVSLYRQAEQKLLDEAVAIPLYAQSAYYAVGPGVTGVSILPGGGFDFRRAWRV